MFFCLKKYTPFHFFGLHFFSIPAHYSAPNIHSIKSPKRARIKRHGNNMTRYPDRTIASFSLKLTFSSVIISLNFSSCSPEDFFMRFQIISTPYFTLMVRRFYLPFFKVFGTSKR